MAFDKPIWLNKKNNLIIKLFSILYGVILIISSCVPPKSSKKLISLLFDLFFKTKSLICHKYYIIGHTSKGRNKMLILNTPNIEGKKITEYFGLVTGEALIGANVYKDLFSGVRDVVGGRTSAYEEEIKKARDIAINSMEEKGEKFGANAILGVNIGYHNLGGTMGNTIMVTVFGTAVKYE